jgi:hypothetical protein
LNHERLPDGECSRRFGGQRMRFAVCILQGVPSYFAVAAALRAARCDCVSFSKQ